MDKDYTYLGEPVTHVISDDGRLLHMVVRGPAIKESRTNLVPADKFLQCAFLRMPIGQTFRPHSHKWHSGEKEVIAQESWVVISGRVKVFFYDKGGKLIQEVVLNPGDASFTFEGGHNYESLEEGTLVYEFKTGPYYGQEADKYFI